MDLFRSILDVGHVVFALLYVAGYLSTGTLTHFARRAPAIEQRNALLALSGRFDFLYQIPFGTLVGLSGLVLFMVSGYSLQQRWVWLSIVLYAAVVFIGAGIWRRLSMRIRAAQEAGDDPRVLALLGDPRVELLRWIERALIITVVVLMVLRPS